MKNRRSLSQLPALSKLIKRIVIVKKRNEFDMVILGTRRKRVLGVSPAAPLSSSSTLRFKRRQKPYS